MSDPDAPKFSRGRNARLAGLGMELAGAVVGGCLLGYWIDRRYGTSPWWLLICTSIGVVGGLYNLIRQAIQEIDFGPKRGDQSGHSPDDDGTPPK